MDREPTISDDGPSQHSSLPSVSDVTNSNIASALVSMAGALNNMTTTWHQAMQATPEMKAIRKAAEIVQRADYLTEVERVRLFRFFGDNPKQAVLVPGQSSGFQKTYFRELLGTM